MAPRLALALALALVLGLAAQQAAAARLFDTKASARVLRRSVGKRFKDKSGKMRYKEVDYDHVGRAAFDPQYGLDEDLAPGDIGYEDGEVHEVTASLIEARLRELFPLIDTNRDLLLSLEELQHHLYANGVAIAHRRADSEFADFDVNKDGQLSAGEYLRDLEGDSAASKAAVAAFTVPSPMDWGSYTDATLAALVLADVNGDKTLSPDEFFDFLNPEEGTNSALKLHRLRGDIHDHMEAAHHAAAAAAHAATNSGTEYEYDGGFKADGGLALAFDDFYASLWPQFAVWEGKRDEASGWKDADEKAAAQRKFVLLDTNADGKLTAEELLPVFNDIHPSESRYARMQAEHMFDMAEAKGDRLSLEEMLRVPHAFYGAVHDEHHEEL